MNAATVVELKRERKTDEQVIAEVKNVLEFAKDFFRIRGKVILATNIECQLKYFNSAEVFEHMDESDALFSGAVN